MHSFPDSKARCTYLFCCFFSLAILVLAGCNTQTARQKETASPIFLIPAGYEGSLYVVYGEKCGVQPGMENGQPVYRFPANGLLVLQAREDYFNKVGSAYYYVDTAGRRQEIRQVIDRSPGWTTDNKGNKLYEDRGNTTLEKMHRNEPVVLIKEHGVSTVQPANIVNGGVTNSEEVYYVFIRLGVYAKGNVDTTHLLQQPDENKQVEHWIRRCKESYLPEATTNK